MKQIHHIVNRARIRMQLQAALAKCVSILFALASLILILSIADRIGQTQYVPWNIVWIIAGAVVLAAGVVHWFQGAVSHIEAAAEIDTRLDLRDRFSSAVSCEENNTPFSKAVLEDAVSISKSKHVAAAINSAFPIAPPQSYLSVLFLAAMATVVLWSGQWMWLGGSNEVTQTNQIASNENIEASIDIVLEQLQNDELLGLSLEEELNKLAAIEASESIDSESLRREALKNITDVQKRLDELMRSEDALAFEDMQRRMQALEIPKLSSMQPMVADLKNGKFDQAKQEFDKLQSQLESTELSDEDKEELKKSLKELAKQLQKLSESSAALSSALAAAGMNENLADNLEAAMKAVQNARELTEEQKKQLLEMIKAQQQAAKMCKNMSEGCKSCANGKPSDGMSSALEKLNAMKSFKTQAEIAKTACQNAAQGMSSSSGAGGGTGSNGQGNGGQNALQETETASIAHKSPVQTLKGTIIARQLFEGGFLTTSESTAAVRETVLAGQRDSEQAIIDEEVPRRYHNLLRHYFGQLEELTEPSDEDDTEIVE